jgi:Cu-Zn family superoxide dismutase
MKRRDTKWSPRGRRSGARWLAAGAVVAFWVLSGSLVGCGGEKTGNGGEESQGRNTNTTANEEAVAPQRATAEINPTEGNSVHGTVTFETVAGGVRVTADIEGLSPGDHGFHIHEYGDCSAPDGSSAGGHYNPTHAPHGGPDKPEGQRHIGDLGNIHAGPDGKAQYDRVDPIISLGGSYSIIGKSVIVHAGADDLVSQPTGDAGPRVACGVIRADETAQTPSGGGS